HVGVPNHALLQWNSHGISRIAPQVLVGKEKYFFVALHCPAKGRARIRRSANQPSALAAKGFDGSRGIHVGKRSGSLAFWSCQSYRYQLVPTALHLSNLG